MTLQSHLLRAALEKGAGITFVRAGNVEERMSYSELYTQALKVLGGLHQKGVRPGNELVIQVQDNKDLLLLFWACILGGIIPVPLSPGVQSQQKTKLHEIWKYLSQPYLADEELQHDVFTFPEPGVVVPVSGNDIAYIQFSSGSTGEPKGVILTHANLDANIDDITKSLEIDQHDTLLSWMPMTHDMGMIGFHLTGVANAIDAISIDTPLFIRRPLLWMEKTNEYRATVLYSPNFGFQYFLSSLQQKSSPGWDLTCIRIIVNGAETISARLCTEFSQTLQPYGLSATAIVAAYGLAEACVEVSAMPVHTPLRSHWVNRDQLNVGDPVVPEREGSRHAVSFVEVGRPVPSCSVRICGNDDTPLPEHTLGHIQIAGKNITSGYYNNRVATRLAFTKDSWLRTGDVGYLADGRLIITGRLKNIIIVNGKNFYPHDIERAIIDAGISEPGKVAACGVPSPDGDGREELVLFLIHKGSQEALLAQTREIAAVVWHSVGIPVDKVVPIRKMPKTTSGKMQYFQLIGSYRSGELKAIPVVHEMPEREDITDILSGLLGCGMITDDTNLMSLGLNSLTAVRFCSRIRQYHGVDIPIEDLFGAPTVGGLRELMRTASLKKLPVLAPAADRQGIAFSAEQPGTAPMSAAQQRIWLEMQLNRSSVAYNIPVIFAVAGRVEVSALERAIRETIKRYEILRTTYGMEDDQPVQTIHPYDDSLFSLAYTDARDRQDAAKELQLIYDREVNWLFDLNIPCQLSARVVRTAEDSYHVILVFHHILTDGWSLGILMKEISRLYKAESNEPTVKIIQYSDYVRWQQELRTTDLYRESKDYWARELAELPLPVTLSGKPPVSDPYRKYAAGHSGKLFTEQEFAQINALAASYGTTPFCIVMVLLIILLSRYTGKKDIVVGFDTSARVTAEMEQVMGYLINTLCLRTTLHEDQSIADLIGLVRKKIMKAIEHQLFPFEDLLGAQKPADSALPNSFFDILVLYQNFYQHDTTLKLEGCVTTSEYIPVRESMAGLVMEFHAREDGLHLNLQYLTCQYDHSEIEQVAGHMSQLLAEIAAQQHSAKIIFLNFLTERERLMHFGFTRDDHGKVGYLEPVHRLFLRQAIRHPDHIAIIAGDRELSYGQLNVLSDRLSHSLRKKHRIERDWRIGLLTSRNENIAIGILGILKSGAAYVPVDPEWPASRRELVMAESGISALVTDEDITHIRGNEEVPVAGETPVPGDTLITGETLIADMALSDLAYVIYTSGSTGKPKGVMIEHATLLHYVSQFIKYFAITEKDVFIQQASAAFDTLVEEVFPALCTGGRIVITSKGGRDTEELLAAIHRNKVTVLTTTPLVLKEINERPGASIASLRTIISGGDVLSPGYIDNLIHSTAEIYNTYGPSETTVCAAYKKVNDVSEAALIGKPIDGYRIYLLDEHMQLLPWGKTGQIYIAGGCARGYLNDETLTRRQFIPNPFEAGSILYKTGDLGRWTAYGELEFLGRHDTQIKVRGHRVELEEVEKVIMGHDGISMAVVQQHPQHDYLVAFLLTDTMVPTTELHAYLAEKLPYYMIPYNYIMVAEMPMTYSGKIDRSALSRLMERHVPPSTVRAVRPQTRLEKLLAGIWEEVLRKQDIGVTDNFFELGGHSLKATQLLNRIHLATGVDIQLTEIFMFPTIREQSQLIAKQEEKQYQYIDII